MPVEAKPPLRRVQPGSPPAWTRRRAGAGFVYLDERGRRITRATTLERIRKLAIPPAWDDVWICPWPDGHVQATGRDARGRLQYRYHPRWRELRDGKKYTELRRFCRALPRLRRRVSQDLRCSCVCRDAVVAGVVELIEKGHLRIGNEEYTRYNGSHGVTTLERKHVRLRGARIELSYRGKSGVQRHVTIDDAQVARLLRRCLRLPGRRVFKYVDEKGRIRRVTSTEVNQYIREHLGEPITAKYFRTWAASLCCLACLAAEAAPTSRTAAKRVVTQAIKQVAQHLGHTPAVCRASYVHPRVIDAFAEGSLAERFRCRPSAFAGTWPREAEKVFLALLG
jgi:DNA topoisomerase I